MHTRLIRTSLAGAALLGFGTFFIELATTPYTQALPIHPVLEMGALGLLIGFALSFTVLLAEAIIEVRRDNRYEMTRTIHEWDRTKREAA